MRCSPNTGSILMNAMFGIERWGGLSALGYLFAISPGPLAQAGMLAGLRPLSARFQPALLAEASFASTTAEFGLTSLMTVSMYRFIARFIAAFGGRGGASRATTSRRDSSALRRIVGGFCREDFRALMALGMKKRPLR